MSLAIQAANRNLFGTIAGGIVGAVGGLITGGPGGVVGGAQTGARIGNALTGGSSSPPAGTLPGKPFDTGGFGGFNFGPSSTPPASGGTSSCGCGSNGRMPNPCAAAYGCSSHLNKHRLAPTRGGCGRAAHGWQEPGTYCVRRRHMNPLNIKALRRADRRAHAFLRISKRVVKHFVAKAPKGKAFIKASRRRSR